MKLLIFSFLISVSLFSWAQDPSRPQLEQMSQGKLLNLKLVPGAKKAQLFLIGKEAANLKIGSDGAMVLKVTAFSKEGETELGFEPKDDSYWISSLPEWKHEYQLKVKTKVKDREEEFHFKMAPQP